MTRALRKPPEQAPFIHRCEHDGCGAWGAFGVGVVLRKGVLGRWYCADHRPVPDKPADDGAADDEPADDGPADDARPDGPPTAPSRRQHRLL